MRQVFCYNQAMNSINIEWGSKILGMENFIGKKIAATHIPLIINPDSVFLYASYSDTRKGEQTCAG